MSTSLPIRRVGSTKFFDFTTLKVLVAGAIFGTALTAAGVYHPSVIFGQLNMRDFTMLKVFLTATATSSIVIPIARYLGLTKSNPPGANCIGWFHCYDGNMWGGALIGAGMALTGACPGTVLPQIVTGVRSGIFVGIGGVLGAIYFTRNVFRGPDRDIHSPVMDEEQLGVNRSLAIVGYQALCGAIVAGAMHFLPGNFNSLVHPVVGGLCIGASQAATLVLTGRTLGVSSAYEQAARLLDWTLADKEDDSPRPVIRSMVFVAGSLLGSFAFSRTTVLPTVPPVHVGALRALFGGGIMVYGARLAGGCTSGHGISGMSQLSKASFITVACMFGAGITVAFLGDIVGL